MHFQLTGELKDFIDECVKSGNFGSQAEVMRSALRRMKRDYEDRNRKIPNQTTIEAFAQAERGDYIASTLEEFEQELDNLKND